MAYSFIKCNSCSKQFRDKKIYKPYIGQFNGEPVFQWCWICPSCGYRHTFRYYNVHLNPLWNKVVSAEFDLMLNSKNEEKYEESLEHYNEAKRELNSAYDEMKRELVPMRKV